MTIEEFLERYREDIRDSEWEIFFAREVLAHVPGLDLAHVKPQVPFRDYVGRERRIDFAIVEDGVRIALEVDGWDKCGRGTGMTPAEFEDWSLREASLVALGWRVQRFANRLVKKRAPGCVKLVQLLLRGEREIAREMKARESEAKALSARQVELTKLLQEALQEIALNQSRQQFQVVSRGEAERLEAETRRLQETVASLAAQIEELQREREPGLQTLEQRSEVQELRTMLGEANAEADRWRREAESERQKSRQVEEELAMTQEGHTNQSKSILALAGVLFVAAFVVLVLAVVLLAGKGGREGEANSGPPATPSAVAPPARASAGGEGAEPGPSHRVASPGASPKGRSPRAGSSDGGTGVETLQNVTIDPKSVEKFVDKRHRTHVRFKFSTAGQQSEGVLFDGRWNSRTLDQLRSGRATLKGSWDTFRGRPYFKTDFVLRPGSAAAPPAPAAAH